MEYKLEDLFDLQMGKTPSRNNPEYWDSEDNKWISIADLTKSGKYIEDTKEYFGFELEVSGDRGYADEFSDMTSDVVLMNDGLIEDRKSVV